MKAAFSIQVMRHEVVDVAEPGKGNDHDAKPNPF
jgi:hypothetical protein